MASIVYDGVGGGGALFEGMKFFILQRVPMRSRWIELVQSNGGEVTKFEKKAQIIIADGARKDAPPESVSWKFIEESAKAGKLVDMEAHRCGAQAGTISERATAQLPRTTRTLYTAEDDRILTKWVLKAERMGRPTKGNQIYMELAARYPQHTYQSWLDHWKRYLLPRHEAGKLHYDTEDGDSPSPERQPKPAKKEPAKPPPTRIPHEQVQTGASKERVPVPDSSSLPRHSGSRSSRPAFSKASSSEVDTRKPVDGRPFTKEDDSFLQKEFVAICNIDPNKEIAAWEAWTRAHPDHTAQEWRNYFHEDFYPREMKERAMKKQTKIKPASSTSSRHVSSPLQDEVNKASTRTKHSTNNPEKASVEASVKSPVTPQNARSRAHHEPKTTTQVILGKIDMEQRPYTNSLLKEEAYFTHTLKEFSEVLGFEPDDLNFHPVVCGKEISIFKLWQIVMLFGGFAKTNADSRWQEVADRLSFPIANRAKAAKDLKSCYEEILSELETAVKEAQNDTENPEFTASQEEEVMIASQLKDTVSHSVQKSSGHDEEIEDNDEVPKLPPPRTKSKQQLTTSTNKRTIDSDGLSNLTGSSATKHEIKRRKVQKGKGKEVEIPSTPEHIFNATQPPISHHTAPLKYPFDKNSEDDSSDHEVRERIRRIQKKKPGGSCGEPSARKPLIEPETQDFHYPDIDKEASIVSPTPAPKKRAANNIIDLSKDSSTESEPEPEPDSESDSEDSINAEFAKYLELGYSREVIAEALIASTYVYDVASVIMEQLKMGHDIPDNMEGAWTKRDDDALLKNRGPEYERIREKHGDGRIAARKKFNRHIQSLQQLD
ncbi:dfd478a8-0622-41fd-a666-2b5044d37c39 [Sclerotinia trifoliorum]|uniref:DNA-binding protein RAP1 n=1 Tax=Sclerotinia trifoliorum TaxID=28548 RepID=A0A8H2W1T4_9HELO|nr:dfd478a8-0622-41fd-a666-2b5044d37c39 [Sclerotinia trifoliorum]